MSFILDRLLKLGGVSTDRAMAAGNAGLPPGPSSVNGPASPFGVEVLSKLINKSGAVRGEPPTEYANSGRNVRILGFQQHPVVHACIRVVTELSSSIPLQVYKKWGGREILQPTSELQRLLNFPASNNSAKSLRASFVTDFQIYGNAFWRLIRPSMDSLRPPVSISRVNPEGMQIVYVDGDLNVLAYVYQDHFGRVRTLDAADMVHFKDLDASSANVPDIFGYPRAAAALTSMAADTEATRYTRQIVGNDGTPTLAVMLNDEVNEEDAQAMQERWQQLAVDRGRRGRAGFFNGVKDIKPIGFTLSNLEFPDLRRVNREDICAVFGVDPRMVGIASATKDGGLSGSQYVEARSRLVQHTVEPLLGVVEDQLNLWLAPEFGDVWIRFDRDVLRDLIEDDTATSNRIRAEFKDGLRSWENSREALRMSPTPDPLESFYMPTGVQLIPAAIMVGPVEAPPDSNAPPPPTGTKEVQKSEPLRLPAPVIDRAIKEGSRVFHRSVKLTAEQRLLLWNNFDERATKQEADYSRTARRLFAEERSDISDIFDSDERAGDDAFIKKALKKIKDSYKPGGEYHERWLKSYTDLIGKTYKSAAGSLASELGLDFNVANPKVEEAIQKRAKKLADYITDTTSRQVTSAVSAGRKAGMGVGQISNLINKAVFGGVAENRSRLIARTETVGAMNEGEFDTAKNSGVMQEKEWLTQGDDRVRDTHAALDGVRIPIKDDFDNGLSYPGDQSGPADEVIQCRCTLLYYDEGAQ